MSIWSDLHTLLAAFASGDSFEIREALKTNSIWMFGAFFLFLAGLLMAKIYHRVPLIERYLERTVMITSYLAIAAIIFWSVIDRFVFSEQVPWSTTMPPLLFMIMAWFGAAYNIRVRTHLNFSEFRGRLPRLGQFMCLWLDFFLWFGFALIILVTTSRLVALSASNFQIVLGTDNTMQWWFLMSAPIAGVLIAARAIENIQDDIRKYREGENLISQAMIGGGDT